MGASTMKPYEASVFMFVWYVVRYPPPVPCANTAMGQRPARGAVEFAAEALEAFAAAATSSAAVG